MRLSLLLLVLACALVTPTVGTARAGPTRRGVDGLDDLSTWVERFVRGQRGYGEPGDERLPPALSTARGVARVGGREGRRAAVLVLLDMLAAGDTVAERGLRPVQAARIANTARAELARLLDQELVRWLASEVLVRAGTHSIERRAAGCAVLSEHDSREVKLALTLCARESAGRLRAAALTALAGRDDEALHGLFAGELARAGADAEARVLGAIEMHFRHVRLPPGSRAEAPLLSWTREHVGSPVWREAALAIQLTDALGDPLAVPLLLDTLDLWIERAEAGEPVRRLPWDVVHALERRSGRNLGDHPRRWRTWWAAVERGDVSAHVDDSPDVQVTRASFFGLNPISDRVTFVIDRSGSMSEPALGEGRTRSEGAWTRYDEAVHQMLAFLEDLGDRTRFNIVLFSSDADVWRPRLARATDSNLRAARKWLIHRKPDGGTHLREGIQAALGIEHGKLDLEDLEADTLIVLCDGETTDGSEWVVPFLRRVNAAAQVVVHAVQIGSLGDGTLELLARESGGRSVRIE